MQATESRASRYPLPGCGERGDALGDLYADVEATRQAIAEAEAPVVLCGHSYGGMAITEAGADQRAAQLLYVNSTMPEAGQSLAELVGSQPTPWMDPGDDGTVGVHADIVRELFLQDCDETTTQQALARFTRQPAKPFAQPPLHIAWQEKPSTCFVCTQDLGIPAELQRQRASPSARVIDVHPFLSQPEAFAETIADEIDAVA